MSKTDHVCPLHRSLKECPYGWPVGWLTGPLAAVPPPKQTLLGVPLAGGCSWRPPPACQKAFFCVSKMRKVKKNRLGNYLIAALWWWSQTDKLIFYHSRCVKRIWTHMIEGVLSHLPPPGWFGNTSSRKKYTCPTTIPERNGKESTHGTRNILFYITRNVFSDNRMCVWEWESVKLDKSYLIDPRLWSCLATERIPSAPRGGRVLESWADQRSSCARWGSADSTRRPAWWWTLGPGTPGWQKCQISESLFKYQKQKQRLCTTCV